MESEPISHRTRSSHRNYRTVYMFHSDGESVRQIPISRDFNDERSLRPRQSQRSCLESSSDLSYDWDEPTDSTTDAHRHKRARVEAQQLIETWSARVNSAVEAGPANHDPLEPPLSDPVIRIHVGVQVFEIQLSRLVHHSEWFSRELGNIDNRDTRKVVLTNVSAEDFSNLVKTMDKTFDFIQRTPPTIELLSILRAAKALEFTSISSYIIKCLKGTWSLSCSKITDKLLQDAVMVIQHAHQFDLPQLLRRAFYEVMRAGVDVTAQGLSDKDSMTALKIQATLQKEWSLFIKAPPQTACDSQSQTGAGSCSSRSLRKEHWMTNVIESTIHEDGMQDPLYTIHRLMNIDWIEQGYCSSCTGNWRTSLKERKTIWWDLLGSFISGN